VNDTTDFDPASVPVRPAATIMLIDDRPDLHVLMMRRNARTVFAGGMWVFPGGRVDDDDRSPELLDACASSELRWTDDGVNFADGAQAYWVATARETFEEAGMLLARAGDEPIHAVDTPRWIEYRRALNAGEISFADIVARENLSLDTDSIHYIAHWVTPLGSPRRFSARFFLARTPPGQDPVQDHSETVRAQWVRPHDAIEAFERDEWTMMTPTVRMLESLGQFSRAGDAVAAASATRSGHTVRVVPRPDSDRYRIVLPGDPGYADGDPNIETGVIHLRP